MQYSNPLRHAQLDQIAAVGGASPKLQIRSGAPPANCAAGDTGSLLCEMSLPSTWMAAAAGGEVSKSGAWSGMATGAGVAGHFRLKAGASTLIQGSVTMTGNGGDLIIDNTSVQVGQTVSVSEFAVVAGNE